MLFIEKYLQICGERRPFQRINRNLFIAVRNSCTSTFIGLRQLDHIAIRQSRYAVWRHRTNTNGTRR